MSAMAPAAESVTRTVRSLRVAVIGGGTSGEHEVSLGSAASARAALVAKGHQPVAFMIERSGEWSVEGEVGTFPEAVARLQACDVALPLVHGSPGEDGALGALCDFAGVPHTGPSVRCGALTMDKQATKALAVACGIAVAPGLVVGAGEPRPEWPGPAVVKPAGGGSSLGVRLVETVEEWPEALGDAFGHDTRVLVEEPITGREVDLAVLRRRDGSIWCGPPLEVVNQGIFSYTDKYVERPHFVVPAQLAPDESTRLTAAALTIAEALELRGVMRVDFFLTDSGIILNEVNAVPGLTDKSQVPLIFAAAGMPYPDLLDELVQGAFGAGIGRAASLGATLFQSTALLSLLLHGGITMMALTSQFLVIPRSRRTSGRQRLTVRLDS